MRNEEREVEGRGEQRFDKLRLTLVMSLYKTLLTGGMPPSSPFYYATLFLHACVRKLWKFNF